MNLSQRSVILTGGGSGIGRELALALAKRGARIVLTGRRVGPLQETAEAVSSAGGAVRFLPGDVREAAHRRTAIEMAVEAFGGLDILVNNAGNIVAGRLETLAEEEIRTMIDVNLIASILFTRDALPVLRQNGSGMVVNICSGMGLIGMPFYSIYGAAKGGLARFSEALRRELLGEGIHVLSIYPTATETPMMVTSQVGPEHGIVRESPADVAADIVAAIESDALEVVRGGEPRRALLSLNHSNPKQVDERFASLKASFEAAVRHHRAL